MPARIQFFLGLQNTRTVHRSAPAILHQIQLFPINIATLRGILSTILLLISSAAFGQFNNENNLTPIKVTKDTKELRFTVETDEKSRVGKVANMFVQVDIPMGNAVATHRIALGSILRLDPARKAAPAPVAKAAAPAAAKPSAAAPAAPVVLSRLEQLRQKNEAPKN